MNTKTLAIAVVILAALAGLAAFLNRPAPPPAADPLVGQTLLAAETANTVQSLTITQGDQSVTVSRTPDADTWQVESYHHLPATVSKLRSFVQSLTTAKVQRVVTRNPERAARLDLGSASVQLTTTSGDTWSIDLGKTAERGGRYLRFGDSADAPAYLADFAGYLDPTAKNWADTKLVAAGRDDIASLTLTFPDEASLTLTRESATADWTAADLPEGQQLKASAISSLLSTLGNLRFTDTTAPDDTDAVDAAAHTRTVTAQTFAGDTFTVTLGRRPEQTVAKAPTTPADPVAATQEMLAAATNGSEPKSADEVVEDLTETIPAGPTFATVTGPTAVAPLAAHRDTLAFKVSDYSFTSLPADHAVLLEPTPTSAP